MSIIVILFFCIFSVFLYNLSRFQNQHCFLQVPLIDIFRDIFCICFKLFASKNLFTYIFFKQAFSKYVFFKAFSIHQYAFLFYLLFYIEDKNHFFKKINLKLDERPVWNSAHGNICPQAKSSQSVSAKILSPIQGNPKQEND